MIRGRGTNIINAFVENREYKEVNGKVVTDKYIRETITNKGSQIDGYDNGKKIHIIRRFRGSQKKGRNKNKNKKYVKNKTRRSRTIKRRK
jgi:hypothetical protein